jgi:hypothetical protein
MGERLTQLPRHCGAPKKTMGLSGCANCFVLKECGGHPLPIVYAVGCVNYAAQALVDTDDMNPLLPDRFRQLWNDVGGLKNYNIDPLLGIGAAGLPPYITQIQNRHMRRQRVMNGQVVALRLFDVVGRRKDGTYGPKYSSNADLRAAYRLSKDIQILLVGVDRDARLEAFWANHRIFKVGRALAKLGLLGVTVPNFSFFTCTPRFQILRNRKRILLVAERLSDAGVPVSPHLNANTEADWDFWLEFLREHPEVLTVTMEFQTGCLENETVGREAFNQLIALKQGLNRPLHVFLVGGGRYYQEARQRFGGCFSVIDSQPFMQTLARNRLVKNLAGNFEWQESLTDEKAALDDLFEWNVKSYPEKLSANSVRSVVPPAPEVDQFMLEFSTSTPYLTAQPSALRI